MNARQFFDRVKIMRQFQKEYYKTRDKGILKQSIALEQEIDAEIARVEAALQQKQASSHE
jgi:hypothetical protein